MEQVKKVGDLKDRTVLRKNSYFFHVSVRTFLCPRTISKRSLSTYCVQNCRRNRRRRGGGRILFFHKKLSPNLENKTNIYEIIYNPTVWFISKCQMAWDRLLGLYDIWRKEIWERSEVVNDVHSFTQGSSHSTCHFWAFRMCQERANAGERSWIRQFLLSGPCSIQRETKGIEWLPCRDGIVLIEVWNEGSESTQEGHPGRLPVRSQKRELMKGLAGWWIWEGTGIPCKNHNLHVTNNSTTRYICRKTENRDSKIYFTWIFITTLSTVAKRWKHPNVHH